GDRVRAVARAGARRAELALEHRHAARGARAPDAVQGQGAAPGERARGAPELSRSQIGRAHVLNSSHSQISYAVFCLKKKKKNKNLLYKVGERNEESRRYERDPVVSERVEYIEGCMLGHAVQYTSLDLVCH